MKNLMIESTEKNYKLINRCPKINVHEFCGWLNISGPDKEIAKIAKKCKVILF